MANPKFIIPVVSGLVPLSENVMILNIATEVDDVNIMQVYTPTADNKDD